VIGVLAMKGTELEALVLALGETLLFVVLVVAMTAIFAELVLLILAMLTVMIVAIITPSIQPWLLHWLAKYRILHLLCRCCSD
jgi:hypothetical protein